MVKYLLLLTLLSSCYTARVAKKDFAKASIAYPAIAAEYCAVTFPIKERVIQGKDSLRLDTIYSEGDTYYDTLYSFRKDTVYITRYLPGKTIRETFYRVDTVYQQETAMLHALQLQVRDALTLSVANAKSSNEWKEKARKRFWTIVGLGALVAIYIGFKIYKSVRKLPLK